LSVLAQYLRTAYGLAVQLRKTVKTESRNKVCLVYAEVHPLFARTAKTKKTTNYTIIRTSIPFFFKKEDEDRELDYKSRTFNATEIICL